MGEVLENVLEDIDCILERIEDSIGWNYFGLVFLSFRKYIFYVEYRYLNLDIELKRYFGVWVVLGE